VKKLFKNRSTLVQVIIKSQVSICFRHKVYDRSSAACVMLLVLIRAVRVQIFTRGFRVLTVHRLQCENVFMPTTRVTIDPSEARFRSHFGGQPLWVGGGWTSDPDNDVLHWLIFCKSGMFITLKSAIILVVYFRVLYMTLWEIFYIYSLFIMKVQ